MTEPSCGVLCGLESKNSKKNWIGEITMNDKIETGMMAPISIMVNCWKKRTAIVIMAKFLIRYNVNLFILDNPTSYLVKMLIKTCEYLRAEPNPSPKLFLPDGVDKAKPLSGQGAILAEAFGLVIPKTPFFDFLILFILFDFAPEA